jgi:hypothetical protein
MHARFRSIKVRQTAEICKSQKRECGAIHAHLESSPRRVNENEESEVPFAA